MKKILTISFFLFLSNVFAQVTLNLSGDIQGDFFAGQEIFITNGEVFPESILGIDLNLSCPITSNENYSYAKLYDVTGKVISENLSYFDNLGKEVQNLSRDMETNKVWVSETFYNGDGLPSLSTFAVPDTQDDCLNFRSNFTVDSEGNGYPSVFSLDNQNVLPSIGGEIKKYYTDYIEDPYHDDVEFPFSAIIYEPEDSQKALTTIGGNKKLNGDWKQGFSTKIVAAQEMYYLFGKDYVMSKYKHYTGYRTNNITLQTNFHKTISKNVDGNEIVAYTDTDGKVWATAVSGSYAGENIREFEIATLLKDGSAIVHIPAGYSGDSLELINIPNNYIFTNLRTYESTGDKSDLKGGEVYRIKLNNISVNDNDGGNLYIDNDGEIISNFEENTISANPVCSSSNAVAWNAFLESPINEGYGTVSYQIYEYNSDLRFYFAFNFGWNGTAEDTLKMGTIFSLDNSCGLIEYLDLGYIKDRNGNDTVYKARIQNNNFQVYTPSGEHQTMNYFILNYGVQPSQIFSHTQPLIRQKVNYHSWNLNYYDDVGRLVKTVPPLGISDNLSLVQSEPNHTQESTFSYNIKNQITESSSPDEGTAKFKYREDGQIRFSQNEKQLALNRFSYTNYDAQRRPLESGESQGSFSSLDPDASFTKLNATDVNQTFYDFNDSTLASKLTTNGVDSSKYQQTFVMGNVSKTSNETSTTWYSYDHEGKVLWIIQEINGLGLKTIDYVYDLYNNVTNVIYQKNSTAEYFEHSYSYDEKQRLKTVQTKTASSSYVTQAEYHYNETGQLVRTNLAQGLQGIDYVYNHEGRLKSINHPSLLAEKDPGGDDNDVFGLSIDYYQGDYLRGNNVLKVLGGFDDYYSGNIKAITYNTLGQEDQDLMTTTYYRYNEKNWLDSANYFDNVVTKDQVYSYHPSYSTSTIPTRDYNVHGITYDPNGNIQTLKRNKNTENGSNKMDELSYVYKENNPNQLLRVDDAITTDTGVEDLKDQNGDNYEYNAIGQLTRNNAEGIDYIYTASGLVSEIKKDNTTLLKFFYNDRGQRVKKESYNPTTGNIEYTDVYMRDASGTPLAIYRNNALIEHTVYGASRLGVYNKVANSFSYEITDHLGNVRAVLEKDNGTPSVLSATDYYPFGMPMPLRNSLSDYRYAYQGQEKDPETGKEAFQLRLWDARIGRWLTTDPKHEFSSPYLGMGNNPIRLIDPDGGSTKPLDDYYIHSDGRIEHVVDGNNDIDRFYYVNPDDGKAIFLGQFSLNNSGLIQLPTTYEFLGGGGVNAFSFSVKSGNEYRSFINPDALASLFGTLVETAYPDTTIVGFSLANGTSPRPSTSHINGKNGDFRYFRTDASGGPLYINNNSSDYDLFRQNEFNDALYRFGWKNLKSFNVLNLPLSHHSTHLDDHHHHLHVQGYAPNIERKPF